MFESLVRGELLCTYPRLHTLILSLITCAKASALPLFAILKPKNALYLVTLRQIVITGYAARGVA